jgi:hypothetical protein
MCVCVLEKERGEDTTNTLNTQTRTPHAHAHTHTLDPSTRHTSQEVRRAVGNMGCTTNDAGPRRETSHTAWCPSDFSFPLQSSQRIHHSPPTHTHTYTCSRRGGARSSAVFRPKGVQCSRSRCKKADSAGTITERQDSPPSRISAPPPSYGIGSGTRKHLTRALELRQIKPLNRFLSDFIERRAKGIR